MKELGTKMPEDMGGLPPGADMESRWPNILKCERFVYPAQKQAASRTEAISGEQALIDQREKLRKSKIFKENESMLREEAHEL